MNGEGFGIAHIGEVTEELQSFDELFAGFSPAMDAKSQDGPGAFGEVFLSNFVIRAAFQAGVGYPGDPGMFLQEFCHFLSIGHMPFHAQAEGFQPLEEEEGIEGGERAAEIAGVTVYGQEGNNYPDLERLGRDVRSALGNSVLIVTRHKTLVEWLAAHGIEGRVIAQATLEDVAGMDVYGILPLWLAAEANSITEVSMPGLPLEARQRMNGGDFTVEEMDKWGAEMHRFVVRKG